MPPAEEIQAFKDKISIYEKEGREIYYQDECHCTNAISNHYGYAKSGKKILKKGKIKPTESISISGIAKKENNIYKIFYSMVFTGYSYQETFTKFIKSASRKIKPNSVLCVDNAPIHHSAEFKAFLKKKEIILEYFPIYSPELNPIEHLWKDIKSDIKKVAMEGLLDLKSAAIEATQRNLYRYIL